MPSPIYPLRLPEGTKERWQVAADERGMVLSEFVRVTVEAGIAGGVPLPAAKGRAGGEGKVFKGPDPKGGKRR